MAERLDSILVPRLISRLSDIAYGLVFWNAPYRSGYLASTVYKDVGEREAVVGVGASYAKFVVEGTAPHEIRLVNGGVLAFEVAGKMVFTSLVHHPGTKPNTWMDKAAAETESQVGVVAAEEWQGVVG